MRFEVGSRVEVFTKKKLPFGVWRCAEIVADNRDGYTVRYYRGSGIVKESVDRVTTEAVRPCPPISMGAVIWRVGDVVEVLDDGCWKVSMIEEVLGEDFCQVRVIGSIDEFQVKKSRIRVRHEWKDNKWVLLRKDSRASSIHSRIDMKEVASNSCNRSSADYSSAAKCYSEVIHKRRALSKEDCLDAIPGDSYSFTGKVPAHASQRKCRSKDDLRLLAIEIVKYSNADGSDHDDCVSSMESVGSCSTVDAISDRVLSHTSAGCSQDSDSLCSDAESFNPSVDGERRKFYDPFAEVLEAHELDLSGYRDLLEKLYASGPLTWKQELALTNVRRRLCVSNDEHLMELRRLKGSGGLITDETWKPYCRFCKDDVVVGHCLLGFKKGASS